MRSPSADPPRAVFDLYKVGITSDPSRARTALREALATAEALARTGRLTAVQQDWLQMLRDALGKLPPEAPKAR